MKKKKKTVSRKILKIKLKDRDLSFPIYESCLFKPFLGKTQTHTHTYTTHKKFFVFIIFYDK